MIQPRSGKAYWENAARVLLQLPPESLSGYEPLLFDAIEDMNWPGHSLFIELLARLPMADILALYLSDYAEARVMDDDNWISGLYRLGERINIQNEIGDTFEKIRLYLESMGW